MDKQLVQLFNFIMHPDFVVFWVTSHPKAPGTIRHKLVRVQEEDDEIKAFIDIEQHGHVDLLACGGDYSDFEVMMEVDWKIL